MPLKMSATILKSGILDVSISMMFAEVCCLCRTAENHNKYVLYYNILLAFLCIFKKMLFGIVLK